jgi:hypothetical protein
MLVFLSLELISNELNIKSILLLVEIHHILREYFIKCLALRNLSSKEIHFLLMQVMLLDDQIG